MCMCVCVCLCVCACWLQVSLLVRQKLIERAQDFYMIVDDVSLTDLSFSREYTAAVEAKQVALQESQRAHFLVEKAKQERQQKIVQAEGEAAAAMGVVNALRQNPGYLKLRRIRAAQNIARTVRFHPFPSFPSSSPLSTRFSNIGLQLLLYLLRIYKLLIIYN